MGYEILLGLYVGALLAVTLYSCIFWTGDE
jgi:hypothetical protein